MSDYTLRYKTAKETISSLTDYILTHTNKLNDFTDGSALATINEAYATELEHQIYMTITNVNTGIREGAMSPFGITRNQATYAYGTVRITFNQDLTNDIYISKGAQFYSTNPLYSQTYLTLEEYYVPAGTAWVDVTVYCSVTGTVGNIPNNIIDSCSDMGNITSVTNLEAFQTGQDEEAYADLVVRFRRMIQGLQSGTVESLENAAMSVDGVTGAFGFDDTYGSFIIYAHDANGDLSDDLKQQVANAVDKVRSAGIRVVILPVHRTTIDLSIGINVPNEIIRTDELLQIVKKDITNYINSYVAGQPIYVSDVIQKVMDESDYGIVNTELTVTANPDDFLLGNVDIDEDSIININGQEVGSNNLHPIDISQDNNYSIITKTNNVATNPGTNSVGWKDATTYTDDNGNTVIDSIAVTNKYATRGNELLKSGTIDVYFIDDDDMQTTVTETSTSTLVEATDFTNDFVKGDD